MPIQFITDDLEAKAFLASHNQLQNMVPQDPYDHVCCIFGTDEAYCGASYDYGHPNAEDNGYTVLIIPRDEMSPRDAACFLSEFRDAGKLYPDCEVLELEGINEPAFN